MAPASSPLEVEMTRAPRVERSFFWRDCAHLPGVPNGARSRNLLFHRQALCRLSYRHRRGGWESKPSSVLDGHLSRSLWDRSRRRLRDGSRLPASASHLITADSEIAAGRITLFTPAP